MPTITGTAGADSLSGGAEPDLISGVEGNDTLAGGAGGDSLSGGAGDDHIRGGGGDPYGPAATGTGDDSLSGGDGNDYLLAGDGADTLDGGAGRDDLYGGPGADQLTGGAGDDWLSPDWGDTLADAGEGNDRILVSPISGEPRRLSSIAGGGGDDSISLEAPAGGLIVDGGAGTNVLTITGPAGSSVDIYLDQMGPSGAISAPGIRNLTFGSNWSSSQTISGHVYGSAGNDTVTTRGVDDWIFGGAGDDTLMDYYGVWGGSARESIFGGEGNDVIYVASSSYVLRGDEGDDTITGGSQFDDIHGNTGADVIDGRDGDDWTVGGKDNDRLNGGYGNDIVYGNLGDDWCDGDNGNDLIRGGQGNDVVTGDYGNDWLSGDRGDDTINGNEGADIFHGSQDIGLDRIRDFSQVQGDRVQLDPGTQYTVYQSGADTVIDMGGGHRMVLEGVTLATLKGDWLFGAAPPPAAPGADKLPSPVASLDQANMAGFTYDPVRNLIYVVTTDGQLKALDVARGTYATVTRVSGAPSSVAITPDGRYALIGDSETTPADASWDAPRTISVIRVDLQTLATERLSFQGRSGERGVADIVIDADGQAYVTVNFAGSGWTPFRTFDADAAAPVFTDPLAPSSIGQLGPLVMSESGRFLGAFTMNSSSGAIRVYDTQTDSLLGYSGWNPAAAYSLIGTGDVSDAGGLAISVSRSISVWNLSPGGLSFAADLSALNTRGGVIGAKVAANGQHIYLWDAAQDHIIVVDRTLWAPVAAVQVRADLTYDSFSSHQGEMDLTADGRYLILDTGKGLEVIDLARDLSIRRTGTDAGERMNGDLGVDTLSGAGGADTLAGYGGDDQLEGGAGADVFIISAGRDRIIDFDAGQGDRVQLEAGTVYTLRQDGADTIIDMTGGHQMVLANVQLSSLPAGWIFGA